jgi:ribonucleotide reductase beta subunit family protein with ferritin-like domain
MGAFAGADELSELYRKWERQHWTAQTLDFTQDRHDWLEITDHERWQWYWLAGFAHFRKSETHGVICLAALLPHLPRPEQQHVVGTQIADESRHAYFFERFHDEVLSSALPATQQGPLSISPAYHRLFLEWPSAVVRKAAAEPSAANLAVAVFQIFIVLEGSIALASFSTIRRLLSKVDRFPGLLDGLTRAHQDEVRHAQLGICLLQDLLADEPAARSAVCAHLDIVLPSFSEVLQPRPARKSVLEGLGLNPLERRQRAFGHLKRHLQALAIDSASVATWENTANPYEASGADGGDERISA